MAETLPYGPVVPNRTDRISKSGVDEIRTLGASVSGALGAGMSFTSTVDSAARARDDVLAADIAGMEGMTYVGAWEAGQTYRVNDVVTHGGDSWARLTAGSTGEPGVSATDWGLVARQGAGGGFGDLNETDVVGLYDTVEGSMTQDQVVGLASTLATKANLTHPMLYDSGWRDITALVPATVASGKVRLMRTGKTVWIDFEALQLQAPPSGTWHSWNALLPAGFRPARSLYAAIAPTWSRNATGGQNAPNWAMGPLRADLSGRVIVYDARDADSTTVYPIQGITSFPTPDAIPSSLPGTPA